MSFFVEFLRNPRRTGALMPSSRWSVEALLEGAEVMGRDKVVELGAGTGAITQELLRRVHPDATLVAVESNPVFAARLQQRFAGDQVRVVCASALQVRRVVDEHRLGAVDRVISALPWTVMDPGEQERILRGVVAALAADGRFSTLLCRHRAASASARRFVELLRRHFGIVRRGRTVWADFPPMMPYHCAAPIRSGER